MTGRPLIVRIVYEFNCYICGNREDVRFPYNPMQESPTVQQAVPEGWTLTHVGAEIQTPRAWCGCQGRPLAG